MLVRVCVCWGGEGGGGGTWEHLSMDAWRHAFGFVLARCLALALSD
jgi:hypothetical protein